jgi:hypothetical protein
MPAEARLKGHQTGRPSRSAHGSQKAALIDPLVQSDQGHANTLRDERGGTAPRFAAYSICIGGAATIGGLAIAAVLRPQSPSGVWFVATILLAAVGGVAALPALLTIERRQAQRDH